jgi:hypothetical protein
MLKAQMLVLQVSGLHMPLSNEFKRRGNAQTSRGALIRGCGFTVDRDIGNRGTGHLRRRRSRHIERN